MSLSTAHIGIAIKDFLEGRQVTGEPATRDNPYAEEWHQIEQVDIKSSNSLVIYTSDGIFEVMIMKVSREAKRAPPKRIGNIPQSLLWKPLSKEDEPDVD